MKKNKENTVKIYPSVVLMVGVLFGISLSLTIMIFCCAYTPAREQLLETPFIFAIMIFFTGGMSTLAFLLGIPRIFSVIYINENGVTKYWLGFIRATQITWEEMKEIRYFPYLLPYIFFSKNVSLENMYYNKILRQKGVIQAQLTKKLYYAICTFTDKPIINYHNSDSK